MEENKDVIAGVRYGDLYHSLNDAAKIFEESRNNNDLRELFQISFLNDMKKEYQEFLSIARKYNFRDTRFNQMNDLCKKVLNYFK